MDLHIRQQELPNWRAAQPETQFQGENSCHELAALLLTESIQYSLHVADQPLYVLYLDQKSCFDRVLNELLALELFSVGTRGETLIHVVNRLRGRMTYLEWEKVLMGPIIDEHGIEQGWVSSSDYHKILARS